MRNAADAAKYNTFPWLFSRRPLRIAASAAFLIEACLQKCLPCSETGSLEHRHYMIALISDRDMIQPR